MKNLWVLIIFLSVFFLGIPPRARGEERDYTMGDLIRRCIDLGRLPVLKGYEKSQQASSYDRACGRANKDWGNYLRSSPEEGNVLAELSGPGCIFRIWSANPSGRILFFIDGEEKPSVECPFADLFSGAYPPFGEPLCYRISGCNCYFPIPYQRSCRVVLRENSPLYYHIGFVTFSPDTRVPAFRYELDSEAKQVLEEAAKALGECGKMNPLQHRIPSGAVHVRPFGRTIPGGGTQVLFEEGGPAELISLTLKPESKERHFLRKSLLRIYWDGSPKPAVEAPLGDFFVAPFGDNRFAAYPMGITEEGFYCNFPMPFSSAARIELSNEGKEPITVEGEAHFHSLAGWDPDIGYFHAKWRRENPSRVFEYPILETRGRGRFVGCALFIHNSQSTWWGEGDEKIWVDGEDFPSFYGTGSEDYFGDAWGHRPHIRPYEGCTLRESSDHSNKTCVYRFHISDDIPFQESFRMTIENYADKTETVDYSSIAYWYQTLTHDDFFMPVSVAERIPNKPFTPGGQEAERLEWRVQGEAKVRVRDDTLLPLELSDGRGLEILFAKRGDKGILEVEVPAPGVYRLFLRTPHEEGLSCCSWWLDGNRVERPAGSSAKADFLAEVGRAILGGEKSLLGVRLERDDPYTMILDAIRLIPLKGRPGVMEGELITVGKTSGERWQREFLSFPGLSSEGYLHLMAPCPGRFFEFSLPVEQEGICSLVARMGCMPRGGIAKAEVDGKGLSREFDSFSPVPALKFHCFGVGHFKSGESTIRLTLTGRNPESTGYDLALDYFSIHPVFRDDGLEGECLKITGIRGGEVLPQALDNRFSGEWHLWFRGEGEGSEFAVELPVEEEGKYTLSVYFTKSWDYGIVQAYLDGKETGESFEGWSAGIVPSGPIVLGEVLLGKGVHTLTFRLVGKQEESKGYFMGVDLVLLEKVE